MMKLVGIAAVVFVAAIWLGLEVAQDPGVVVVQVRGTTYETSAAVFAIALLVLFVLLYATFRLLGSLRRSPRKLRKHRAQSYDNKAHHALTAGLLELTQGHWQRAEKVLVKALESNQTAALGYMAAARAAQEQGKLEQRNRYLALAHEKQPNGADVALGVTEAQLLMANQELESAAAVLRKLYRQDPKNRLVLKLLKDCYVESHNWNELVALVDEMEKYKAISPNEALHLERMAYGQLLAKAANASEDSRALDEAWLRVPHGLRRDPEMLSLYLRYLMESGEGRRPESILREKLRNQWDDRLAYLYGLVDSGEPAKQLATAEKWLKKHPDNPTLLLTLGRLALRNHLWGKARAHLEKSASIQPRPETYMLLGKLLEQIGDTAIAGECFRKGLGITVEGEIVPDRLIESDERMPYTEGSRGQLQPVNNAGVPTAAPMMSSASAAS